MDSPLEERPIDVSRRFYADTAVFGAPHACLSRADALAVAQPVLVGH